MPTRDAILEVWRQLIKHVGKENTPSPFLVREQFSEVATNWLELLADCSDAELQHAADGWMRHRKGFPTRQQFRSFVLQDRAAFTAWQQVSNRQHAIDLLDQACQEGAFCDTHPKCGVGCVACTRTILARANQLAQEITDGSTTQSEADAADGQDVQRRPGG